MTADTREAWRAQALSWREWADGLLERLGRQPRTGQLSDEDVKLVINALCEACPGVARCVHCGCFATRHDVDDEELRACMDCECTQFETDS